MIRASNFKLKIYFSPCFDEGHRVVSSAQFSCPESYWLPLATYMTLYEYAIFDLSSLTESEKAYAKNSPKMAFPDRNKDVGEYLAFQLAYPNLLRMYELLQQTGGHMVFQFNAINKNFDGYIRAVVTMGGKDIIRWTWFDAYVKKPVYKTICAILNGLGVAWLCYKLPRWKGKLWKMLKN
jgi:hypothetical protein